jgi:hypothetical protein
MSNDPGGSFPSENSGQQARFPLEGTTCPVEGGKQNQSESLKLIWSPFRPSGFRQVAIPAIVSQTKNAVVTLGLPSGTFDRKAFLLKFCDDLITMIALNFDDTISDCST